MVVDNQTPLKANKGGSEADVGDGDKDDGGNDSSTDGNSVAYPSPSSKHKKTWNEDRRKKEKRALIDKDSAEQENEKSESTATTVKRASETHRGNIRRHAKVRTSTGILCL